MQGTVAVRGQVDDPSRHREGGHNACAVLLPFVRQPAQNPKGRPQTHDAGEQNPTDRRIAGIPIMVEALIVGLIAGPLLLIGGVAAFFKDVADGGVAFWILLLGALYGLIEEHFPNIAALLKTVALVALACLLYKTWPS
jgi:hypothetical protein